MSPQVLDEIEQTILELPDEEQLLLISRVAEKLRLKAGEERDFESELSKMAMDENIQKELKEIADDFRDTELDGLA